MIEFFILAFIIASGATLGYYVTKLLIEWLDEFEQKIMKKIKKK